MRMECLATMECSLDYMMILNEVRIKYNQITPVLIANTMM